MWLSPVRPRRPRTSRSVWSCSWRRVQRGSPSTMFRLMRPGSRPRSAPTLSAASSTIARALARKTVTSKRSAPKSIGPSTGVCHDATAVIVAPANVSTAHRRAAIEVDEPSTPTTTWSREGEPISWWSGTMTSGTGLWSAHQRLTDPVRLARTGPRPRVPTTSAEAFAAFSHSVMPASPCTTINGVSKPS